MFTVSGGDGPKKVPQDQPLQPAEEIPADQQPAK